MNRIIFMADEEKYIRDTGDTERRQGNRQFVCRYCGRIVDMNASGTRHRNHCPGCLRSVHVDEEKGDRSADCGGIMEPIAVAVRQNGEWVLIHRCTVCGVLKGNRVAGDDNEMALLSLAVRPVARPPFPLDGLYKEKNSKMGKRRKS
jgi:hypothetical protein